MSDHKVEEGLYYAKTHEWLKIDGDTAIVGLTDNAQNLLTDVVFVELPETGKEINQAGATCVVESVKSVSDVYAPIGGKISKINSDLEDTPELVNSDPYGDGWMFELTEFNTDETSKLMSAEEYKEFVASEEH